jgi:hypothetical protein
VKALRFFLLKTSWFYLEERVSFLTPAKRVHVLVKKANTKSFFCSVTMEKEKLCSLTNEW